MSSPSSATGLPQIVWPSGIRLPARPPVLVYLDLNHWISLARAAREHATPAGYPELLTACSGAVASGRARFVLSAVHYVEMSSIADPEQRAAVAAVMAELTNFSTLLGRVSIAELELEAAVAAITGRPGTNGGLALVDRGVRYAFGLGDGFSILDDRGVDVTEQIRRELGAREFDDLIKANNMAMEMQALAGPSDEKASELRATTAYSPETLVEGNERRAELEREQAARLDADPRWRRGRLRDVVAARELALEWLPKFNDAVGPDFELVVSFLSERENARWFIDCMPSSRVAVSMKTAYHRNPGHEWTRNDINDIDAMSIAVPYCDAVFTDAAARNALVSSRETRVLRTFLPRRVGEMTTWLDNLADTPDQ